MLIALLALTYACTGQDSAIQVEGRNIPITASITEECPQAIIELLEKGREAVDSIKSPIIGTSSVTMDVKAPESPLMNFAADALREEAARYTKSHIDIAISNKGGLRSELGKGSITFGDIYDIFPFENTLTLLTLNGKQLMQLFTEIAIRGGEPISGARLEITPDGRVTNATVNGEKVIPEKNYRIATSDYLSQGNDGLATLAQGKERYVSNITIRQLMIDYISRKHSLGESISSTIDGRITVSEGE